MKRHELEHLIRAAGAVTDTDRIVIVGSQAILGAFSSAPPELLMSMEADMWPDAAPEKSVLIDGSIGELSPFHDTFGYYAHGVGPETVTLPREWKTRAVHVINDNTRGVTGICIHPVDLSVSKIIAGREKDFEYVRAMFREHLISRREIDAVKDELSEEAFECVRAFLERVQPTR